ncbi:chloride channel protein-like isoform X1 [Dreissena polymorpha]|nr:chloride channel protein-like isoform X1 [Dreissena polymorpha]XP_052225775.1 chloride channel protein-like isoform X1 [Dreissena polymorpha]XP_052225776.1 chloride channel protein-like isoform X1 [Dreissena polymorpha]XP_052225777.1 chloride channel protein-like isoform X1 [Dreissena polymorpha]XP_052225778.1 chloride channel protein-like isoform X1 [Dreissena polymorpha]XP_052225779.1 chloride channel protein-like isoform X1 [Dreissena polymorpha]
MKMKHNSNEIVLDASALGNFKPLNHAVQSPGPESRRVSTNELRPEDNNNMADKQKFGYEQTLNVAAEYEAVSTNKLTRDALMYHNQKFGYAETLIYGQYRKDLGSVGKFQAKLLKSEDKSDIDKSEPTETKRLVSCWYRVVRTWHWVVKKVGEDWILLALLGIIMALLSFAMDYVIEKLQEAKMLLYEEFSFSVPLQYVGWVLYSLLLIMFATGFTHLMSPQAIGSGIPEMKTILRGVVLKEFLTFRTLVSKVVGLCCSLGSTLPLGKEGPFVHVASIVANLLGKLTSFKAVYENESRRTEMLAAACAVGVACTFVAPIGGVLFSIEVTATYFAVRNYWRGFFGAVCGAVVFRLLAFGFKNTETLTAMFQTSLKTDFPFDPVELLAFSFVGIACGFIGALFILCHRKIVLFTRKHKQMSAFLQKNRFIYPGIITLVVVSCTFPPGLGQFFASMLTHKKALNELFSNITWTENQPNSLKDETVLGHWNHPSTNIYVTLVLFIINNFWMAAICNTLPIPAGVFVPVFTIGAAFGRLVGECMAAWFPNGVKTGDTIQKIIPGGYAVVGAAALSGSVTRTISTAVIVFEVTGQISHVLPAVIAVLLSNAVANFFQPSFFDSIINLKRLPYLPDIASAGSWSVYVEDIMVSQVSCIYFVSTFKELKEMLETSKHRTYPLVDSPDSMILLGSVKRFELERLLWVHLSQDQKVFLLDNEDEEMNSIRSTPGSFRTRTPPPRMEIIPQTREEVPKPRFSVTKVEENVSTPRTRKSSVFAMAQEPISSSVSNSTENLTHSELQSRQYNTMSLPLRSILKNKRRKSVTKASAFSDLRTGLDEHFRRLSKTHTESIVEDIPFVIKKDSIQQMARKVMLPPEPVKVKTLSEDKKEAWEEDQLAKTIEWEGCQIDPAPFQLVERTSLHKVHSLFSLLGLNHAYVTNTGRLMGVVALKELRNAIQGHIDAEHAKKKSFQKTNGKAKAATNNATDSEDDILNDPQQLEVEHPQEPDGYRIVHRSNGKFKYEPESDTDSEDTDTSI